MWLVWAEGAPVIRICRRADEGHPVIVHGFLKQAWYGIDAGYASTVYPVFMR
jgi:hypothetical protein